MYRLKLNISQNKKAMFPLNEKYRINGHKNSNRTVYYNLDGKKITAQEISDLVNCDVNKARLFLNKYNMPPEKFVKLMTREKDEKAY